MNRENENRIHSLGWCHEPNNQEDYIDMLICTLESCKEDSEEYIEAMKSLNEYYPHRYYTRGEYERGWIAYDLYSMSSTDGFETEEEAEDYIKEWYME